MMMMMMMMMVMMMKLGETREEHAVSPTKRYEVSP